MFLAVAASTIVKLRRVSKKARAHPELEWLAGLSDAVQSGILVFLSSGAFVGIVFQPIFWYFIALGVSVNAYLWRVEHAQPAPVGDPRLPIGVRPIDPLALPDWRNRQTHPGLNVRTPRR
jgi:hypothetical protein